MKKTALLLLLSLASITLCAQNKGEKYIGAAVSASLGSQTNEISDGTISTSNTQPMNSQFTIQGEFGYFIADNVKIALALGIPFISTPTSKDGNSWLHTKTLGFQINPNFSYYMRIADGLYYTPEIGGSYELGKVKEELTSSETYNANYTGWSAYLQFLSFEYRININFAVWFGAGSLSHVVAKVQDKSSDMFSKTTQTGFKFNDGSMAIRYYF